MFDARSIQTADELQMLRREAETARRLRDRQTARPLLALRFAGWQLTLDTVPRPT